MKNKKSKKLRYSKGIWIIAIVSGVFIVGYLLFQYLIPSPKASQLPKEITLESGGVSFALTSPQAAGEHQTIEINKEEFKNIYKAGHVVAYTYKEVEIPTTTISLSEGTAVSDMLTKSLQEHGIWFDGAYLYDLSEHKLGDFSFQSNVLDLPNVPDHEPQKFADIEPVSGIYGFGLKQIVNGMLVFDANHLDGVISDTPVQLRVNTKDNTMKIASFGRYKIEQAIPNVPLLDLTTVEKHILEGKWQPFYLENRFDHEFVRQDSMKITSIKLAYLAYQKYLVPFYLLCGESESRLSSDKGPSVFKDRFCGSTQAIDYSRLINR